MALSAETFCEMQRLYPACEAVRHLEDRFLPGLPDLMIPGSSLQIIK